MSFSSRGFTLMEMIVVILVTAILMAMAAPLIVHLVDGYEADAQGADSISATGPAIWRMRVGCALRGFADCSQQEGRGRMLQRI